jgi:hypothetical protein
MKAVQNAMNERGHDHGRYADKSQAGKQGVTRGEYFGRRRVKRIYRSHAAENHRGIQERIDPTQFSYEVISEYADSQAYGQEKQREKEVASYPLCKFGPTQERLLSMFVHGTFNKHLLRQTRVCRAATCSRTLSEFWPPTLEMAAKIAALQFPRFNDSTFSSSP